MQQNNVYLCRHCNKSFLYEGWLLKHYDKKRCTADIIDNTPPKNVAVTQILDSIQTGRGDKIKKKIHCSRCAAIFDSRGELYRHYMLNHRNQIGGQLQSPPWEIAGIDAPWVNNGIIDEQLRDTYEIHASLILENHTITPLVSHYNFPIGNEFNMNLMMRHIHSIYEQNQKAMKINVSFAFVLKHKDLGKYRFFKAYTNNSLFDMPFLISKRSHLQKLEEKLSNMDVISYVTSQRPHTKYVLILLTNVVYTTFSLSAFTMGNVTTIPNYIKYKKCIRSLQTDFRGHLIKDNLCFFRCLSLHTHPFLYTKQHAADAFEKQVISFYNEYQSYISNKTHPSKFEGVTLQDIPSLEACFRVNINIFKLHEDSSCSAVYKSPHLFENAMNLNQYGNHLSFITDIQVFCQKFQCSYCTKLFKRKDAWRRHEKTCETKRNLNFVGGFFKPKLTIFQELDNYGVHIPTSKRFFEHFIVFDLESVLSPANEIGTDKLTYTHIHIPISASVCSNLEDFQDPYCIVRENVDALVSEMLNYMRIVRENIYQAKIISLSKHFTQLDMLIMYWENKQGNGEFNISQKIMLNQLNSLRNKFERYCSEIPVLGFNSGRYDINLIKSKIIASLHMEKSKNYFVVKKNNRYCCISNSEFKFLDVTQFLSPDVDYKGFLKAFLSKNAVHELRKGFFPYEYFQDISQLEETQLPPLGAAWWSSLKNKSVLDDGEKTIQENYSWLEKVWEEEGMQNFKDFLIWYNNLDVFPFVNALSRLCRFYFEKGIDIFKETISVPGVARKMIFESAQKANASFSLIDEKNADLHHTINNNIVGGPSIIFNRLHVKDKTFIRNNPIFPCKRVVGLDANSLYLFCIGMKMPTGGFIRRTLNNGFKPERREKYESMFHWMDWLNKTHMLHIQHYRNCGKEKRIGPYLVDGFDEKINTVFQYQGCFFHSHSCITFDKIKSQKEKDQFFLRQTRTKAAKAFIKQEGYKVVEMYECVFNSNKIKNKDLRDFINQQSSIFTRKKPRKVSENEIIDGVLCEDIFGMVEVDICVPDSWQDVAFKPSSLPPFLYFSEMSPIFLNHDVTFNDIGEFMQKHVTEHGLSTQPRKMLVGGMRGHKVLIATPLLRWYILHGMRITKIYQVVEYNNPSSCFQEFVQEITHARREGDRLVNENGTGSVLSDTMKLIGNSAFGSMIMNKAKHKKIYYVKGHEDASKAVNDDLFENLTEIGGEYYEVESFKPRIDLNLPNQIGYFILQLAKLHMLRFYYDFLEIFLGRERFQLTQMDTDSLYFAISTDTLEESIKPSMKEIYEKTMKGNCRDTFEPFMKETQNEHTVWFPRNCCKKHEHFDRRTPGLFKLEFSGDFMISLCSKSYLIADNNKIKFSSKGINKRFITDPKLLFQECLENRKGVQGKNIGFRMKENNMYTYQQDKIGFSYVYCKRKLMDDGLNTLPLDITLSPYKKAKLSA